MRMLAVVALLVAGSARASFRERHSIIQRCGTDSQGKEENAFWHTTAQSVGAGFAAAGLPFDAESCVSSKDEERAAVDAAVASVYDPANPNASATNPVLIVAAVLQPFFWDTFASGDFSTYRKAFEMSGPVVLLWLEVGPDVAQYNLSLATSTSVVFSPNSGRLPAPEQSTLSSCYA